MEDSRLENAQRLDSTVLAGAPSYAVISAYDKNMAPGVGPRMKKRRCRALLLSVLEARPRHGYELGKLIGTRSGGRLVFHLDSLYPLLYRLEEA